MGIVFKIALANVFWEYGGEDTRYFSTLEEQKAYFDNLIGGNLSPLFNFQINDSLSTVVYFKDTTGRNIIESLRCNYAIVIAYDEETNEELTRKYYFAKVYQDSNIQLRVELELDDIQTNYIQFRNQIVPCFINRATLNRWKEPEGKILEFNNNIDSPLLNTEKLPSPSKILKSRTELTFNISNNTQFSNWYKDNILGWEYYYMSHTGYKFYSFNNNVVTTDFTPDLMNQILKGSESGNENSTITSATVVFAVPIYKGSNRFIFNTGTYGNVVIDSEAIKFFRENNNNSSYFYNKKFSIKPPFNLNELVQHSSIVNNNIILDTDVISGPPTTGGVNYCRARETNFADYYCTGKTGDTLKGLVCCRYDLDLMIELDSKLQDIDFSVTELIDIEDINNLKGRERNFKFNPKLYQQSFRELNIVLGVESFTYDTLMLGNGNKTIGYTEVLTPDITKAYARFINLNGIYISDTERNFTGTVNSADNSMMYDNDKLSQMLAENKNFYLQQIWGIGVNGFKGLLQTSSQEKRSLRNLGLAETAVDTINGFVNLGLTTDNLRNAPHQLQNAMGNIYFQGKVQNLMPAIEIYDILDNDKKAIDDYLFKFGFSYGRIGNIEDFANTRKYFDYISADVDLITASISNDEKYRLKQRLKSVRFWHTDTIQYDLENYEKYLEELIDG